MKTLKIEIPEGHEIDQENSTFEKIVFKEVKSKYPLKVEDIPNRDWYIHCNNVTQVQYENLKKDKENVSTRKRAKAFLALMQLVELRDAWNEIDGGKEFTCDDIKYSIKVHFNEITTNTEISSYKVLHFRKEETRDKFLETFRDLIEQAKELI